MTDRQLAFWRPNQKNTGSVAFLESNIRGVFLSFMPQGNVNGKKFDKSKKINAALGIEDIGEMLAVINGRTEGLGKKTDKGFSGLIHKIQGSNNSSIIGFSPSENGYYLSLSAVRDGGSPQRLSVSLGAGNMETLGVFLRTILVDLLERETVSEQAPETAETVQA